MRHQFSLLKDRVGCSTEHRSHREQEDITTQLFRQVMRMLGKQCWWWWKVVGFERHAGDKADELEWGMKPQQSHGHDTGASELRLLPRAHSAPVAGQDLNPACHCERPHVRQNHPHACCHEHQVRSLRQNGEFRVQMWITTARCLSTTA